MMNWNIYHPYTETYDALNMKNHVIKENRKVAFTVIKVTDAAMKQIKEELQDFEPEMKESYLRIHMGYGWGGPRLQLALVESVNPNDSVTEIDGIKFVVDKGQAAYFENTKLDFVKSMFGFGEFRLVNR